MYNICNFNLNSTSIISFDSPHKGECCSQGRSSDLESRGLIVLSLFHSEQQQGCDGSPHFLCPNIRFSFHQCHSLALPGSFQDPSRNKHIVYMCYFFHLFIFSCCFLFVKILKQVSNKFASLKMKRDKISYILLIFQSGSLHETWMTAHCHFMSASARHNSDVYLTLISPNPITRFILLSPECVSPPGTVASCPTHKPSADFKEGISFQPVNQHPVPLLQSGQTKQTVSLLSC